MSDALSLLLSVCVPAYKDGVVRVAAGAVAAVSRDSDSAAPRIQCSPVPHACQLDGDVERR